MLRLLLLVLGCGGREGEREGGREGGREGERSAHLNLRLADSADTSSRARVYTALPSQLLATSTMSRGRGTASELSTDLASSLFVTRGSRYARVFPDKGGDTRIVKFPLATSGHPQAWTGDGVWKPCLVRTAQMDPGKPASSRELHGFVWSGLSTYTV